LDRLMSEDMRTYRVMSEVSQKAVSVSTSNNPVSMSDESEVARMIDMQPGLGDALYDEETLRFAADMGIVTEVINNGGRA
jgi:hypothetical protein